MIAVHVTHEAVEKMGGIGAVIAGLVTSPSYQDVFERTVLVGPLFQTDKPAPERLGPGGKVIYSSLDGIDLGGWGVKFRPIEQTYQAGIIYGTRRIIDGPGQKPVDVEVILLDVFRVNSARLNLFKAELYTKYDIPSDQFEKIWEFEQYVRLAEPGYEALHVIGCEGKPHQPMVILAHEYMGMPLAMKAMLDGRAKVRTVFYAHEVASARKIVESHPGHDLMFYNVLQQAKKTGKSMEDYFPLVHTFFKHPLIKAARHCDAIFAVGDHVGNEMRFLDAGFKDVQIEMAYNGVPAGRQSLEERMLHRRTMREYSRNLFGNMPDYIFTHVARPVLSKGVWRDLRVLDNLDARLAAEGRSATYFMLGTLAGQRSTRDILHMEKSYGWPVHHSHGYPDLCNGEETLSDLFEQFNRDHQAVRVVLVNQFGWERRLCGMRMPEEMSFEDVRAGSDVEFGMSVYEPFGISQLEPLCFGAICLVSNVCGCLDFARAEADGHLPPNVMEADFTTLPPDKLDIDPMLLGLAERDAVETAEGKRLAEELFRRLPRTQADFASLLESGWKLGKRLDWDEVVQQCILPAIERMCRVEEIEEEAEQPPVHRIRLTG